MRYALRLHKENEVDDAGDTLIDPNASHDKREFAYGVINNWRAIHNFPLNTFQTGLRIRARKVNSPSITAQRLKRLSSIDIKLRRFKWLKLSQMQDIGGCRAVVTTAKQVFALAESYRKSSLKHKLDDHDDYITTPKSSGYRGYHLIYRYFSDKKTTYNGLKIEVQLRSQLQHAWATAVETIGAFTKQALKSSLGEKEWLRFFALMGTAIARREETPRVAGTPEDDAELKKDIKHYASKLDVLNRLRAFGLIIKERKNLIEKNTRYFLLQTDPEKDTVSITGYTGKDSEKASADYLKVEKELAGKMGQDAVLVSVDSLETLERAYPNYFLDTKAFHEIVRLEIE